jgi:hypothetical protein
LPGGPQTVILLPLPPEELRLQAFATIPGHFATNLKQKLCT